MNNLGLAVGTFTSEQGTDMAFSWNDGAVTVLNPADFTGGYLSALAVNDTGQIAGFGAGSAGGRAFSWQDGELTWLASDDENSVASAINERGQILGAIGSRVKVWEVGACGGGGEGGKDAGHGTKDGGSNPKDAGAPEPEKDAGESGGKTW